MQDLRPRRTARSRKDPRTPDDAPGRSRPIPTATATGMTTQPGSGRRHLGSRPFRLAAGLLLTGIVAAEGLKLASDLRHTEVRPPMGVRTGPYNGHWQRETELQRMRRAVQRRDPATWIVLYPGYVDRLIWPPGTAWPEKHWFAPEDIKALALHLHHQAERIGPDTVIFESVILIPDRLTQARIAEHNRHPAALIPPLAFDRRRVPITAGRLAVAPPENDTSLEARVLKCMIGTCHKLPPAPGIVGHPISEALDYDPLTYGSDPTNSRIGFGTLAALPDHTPPNAHAGAATEESTP
jgi:hypothetical protein